MSGPRRWREEGLGEGGVGNSIREVVCNDPGKSLWGFRQEATEDFLKSDFSGGEGRILQGLEARHSMLRAGRYNLVL